MSDKQKKEELTEKSFVPGFDHQIEPRDLLSGCFLAMVLLIALIIALVFGGWY